MSINAHLRECHGYSLAESVRYHPTEMDRIHDAEHAETETNHTHDGSR